MFEKVNPSHPDKVADRIAGAIVDLAYEAEENPKIAVEVLIGHGICYVIAETSVELELEKIGAAVQRIAPGVILEYTEKKQDEHLAMNQRADIRCGDNGIFKGCPVTDEQKELSELVRNIYKKHPCDGKYILDGDWLTGCQSNVKAKDLWDEVFMYDPQIKQGTINPLGDWTGGTDVDCGATNRKLGSDMGDAVTGGGLHGKDLSKADVSLNIYAHLLAQQRKEPVYLRCSIGDGAVDGRIYSEIVEIAREYINAVGGFEKFAEWGLI